MKMASLNEPQLEATEYIEGPLLVLAGAGSGKTRVLTHRAVYMVNRAGISPWNLLCITFTNKAAKEMRTRIDDMLPGGSNDVTVSTFHSLCLHILFRFASRIGYDTNFEICDTTDQKQVIRQVCKDLNIDTKKFKEKAFLNEISAAKDELMTPEDYAREAYGEEWYELCAKVYSSYQETLKRLNSFDFDDLIMQTVKLFQDHPDVLDYYQNRYRYIMVDEYQDTNIAQFELIRLLASKYRNLCVVGDDDQSIYKFRGANIRNILDFEQHYPEAKVVRLEQNYRSTKNILNAANAVIANNESRKEKKLWTSAPDGDKLNLRQFYDSREEAAFVAQDIREMVSSGRFKYGDCAILMRTNVQSKEFEDAFRTMGIDYDLVKGLRFWDTKVIKDLTSYLMTVYSGANDVRCARIINVPARGIGAASVEKLRIYAQNNGISIVEACRAHAGEILSGKSLKSVEDFAGKVYGLRERMEELSYSELLDEIIAVFDYEKQMLDDADTRDKLDELWDYVDKLKEALDVYEGSTQEPDLADFMRINGLEGNNINASIQGGVIQKDLTEEEEKALREKKVLIMTMHNAKGLEFPNVYLVGMEEGLFPGFASIFSGDESDIEEERRLCYVAITRARERLTFTGAKFRMINGELRNMGTSRFLKEVPFVLFDMDEGSKKKTSSPGKSSTFKLFDSGIQAGAASKPSKTYAGSVPANAAPARQAEIKRPAVKKKPVAALSGLMKGAQIKKVKPDYGKGDRVRHIKFGEGTVTDVTESEKDYVVTVDFDDAGVKKMFASFARLVKI